MKQYLNYFKWLFGIVVILAVVYLGLFIADTQRSVERTNEACRTEERVFDYGEVLSETEEQKLRKLIAKREKSAGCDIVLVTLNESLKEYARQREEDVPYNEFVRVYAEEFYDTNGFGYNQPIGDGVLLVDNWFREDDGRVYTWFTAVGAADEKYTSARTERLLDDVYEYIESNPYKAYKAYIDRVYYDMTGKAAVTEELPAALPFGAAVVAMLIFIVMHWKSRKGKKTVLATTYVNGGRPHMNRREDILVNKVVTKRRIQTDSGSGGGGRSGGGRSHGGHHGGGGRSR